MEPIQYPPTNEKLDDRINELCGSVKIDTFITETKASATRSLFLGILLFVFTLAGLGWVTYYAKCDEQIRNENQTAPSTGCNNMAKCMGCYCASYDSSIYGFLGLIGLFLAGSFILLRAYTSSLTKINSFQNEVLVLRNIQAAWEASKSFATWAEKDPETSDMAKTKGKEWCYPRQKAQQQIVEALLARS